ncbi:ParB/RepB/Spo0J family partition protein [Alphaproteobacteria bacterium]|nr:ParB/RepB/Spo0J family partition protein [Alphaproteobacteria bacterium]
MVDNIKKKRLKTGLDILLGTQNNEVSGDKYNKNNSNNELNISDIKPNLNQPRSYFDENSIKELANSIKEQGLLMPILVKKDKESNNKNKFIIIAGERRWRACKSLRMKTINAIVIQNTSEKSDALAAIIENVQRENLSVLEEAIAYDKLIKNYGMKHEEIAKSTGKSRSYITNLLRLLSLKEGVKKLLNEKKISFGHARALLNEPNQLDLAHKVIKDNMSVRQLESLLREVGNKDKKNPLLKNSLNLKDANIVDYEKYLSLKLGYKVEIKDKEGKGYLLVRYKSLEQLDAIIDLFNN